MKTLNSLVLYLIFTISYAVFLSVGFTCLLNLLGCAMAISLDGGSVIAQYPRFVPFCLAVGVLSLILLGFVGYLNFKISEKMNYSKQKWTVQWICAVVISFPMIKIWEILFEFLQKTF